MINELCLLVSDPAPESLQKTIDFCHAHQEAMIDLCNKRHKNRSILSFAAQSGHISTFIYLVTSGFDLTSQDEEYSLIFWAALNPSSDILTYLFHPDNKHLISRIHDGTTELHMAAFNGDLIKTQEIITIDPEALSASSKDGHDALLYAALSEKKHPQILQYFAEKISQMPSMSEKTPLDAYQRRLAYHYWMEACLAFQRQDYAQALQAHHHSQIALKALQIKHATDLWLCIHNYYQTIAVYFRDLNQSDMCHRHIAYFESDIDLNSDLGRAVMARSDCNDMQQTVMSIKMDIQMQAARIRKDSDVSLFDEKIPLTPEEEDVLRQITQRYELQPPVDVAHDGSCLFHAVLLSARDWPEFAGFSAKMLRDETIEYIKKYRHLYQHFFSRESENGSDHLDPVYEEDEFEEYLRVAAEPHFWGDEYLISALSRKFRVTLVILPTDNTLSPRVFKSRHAIGTIFLLNAANLYFLALFPENEHLSQELQDLLESSEYDEVDRIPTSLSPAPYASHSPSSFFYTRALHVSPSPTHMSFVCSASSLNLTNQDAIHAQETFEDEETLDIQKIPDDTDQTERNDGACCRK